MSSRGLSERAALRLITIDQVAGSRALKWPNIIDVTHECVAIEPGHAITGKHLVLQTPSVLKLYVGTYAIAAGVDVTISLDGEHFFCRCLDSKGCNSSRNPKVTEVQVDFVQDASGTVTQMISHQGGRDTKAKRIGE
jgi:hypothetical protein